MAETRELSWLVTAGPTCEDIDPVRFITNRSSGRMGYAVAAAAAGRGDRVTLVSGPVAIEAPGGCEVVRVRSAREMYEAVTARYAEVDIVVMAAAVADFRPRTRAEGKIKKTDGKTDGKMDGGMTLELERTEDILAELGARKGKQVLVGFALEAPAGAGSGITDDMRSNASAKLAKKNLDAIVLNGPAAFGSDRNAVEVIRSVGEALDWGEAAKTEHARRIVGLAAELALAR
ncbi:MAG: phosphopantothenoylcysteine decarboxylase domain-containing protein [Planctomycetota bacterium]|jgi:phosphopantothenoylcysteine decarboxylase/phosphopantothenate--cysteine ligase